MHLGRGAKAFPPPAALAEDLTPRATITPGVVTVVSHPYRPGAQYASSISTEGSRDLASDAAPGKLGGDSSRERQLRGCRFLFVPLVAARSGSVVRGRGARRTRVRWKSGSIGPVPRLCDRSAPIRREPPMRAEPHRQHGRGRDSDAVLV